MDIELVRNLIISKTIHDYGNFFGGVRSENSVGVGLFFNKIRYPVFNVGDVLYDTREGLVYILTHECDIDQKNIRPFNEYALICPVIPLESFHHEMSSIMDDSSLSAFYSNLGMDNVSRLSYIPPIPDYLPYGGVLYYNQITHTHISSFKNQDDNIESMTYAGLRIIDYKITNHMLRPKAENLSLMRY